jgi:hypothetical protein
VLRAAFSLALSAVVVFATASVVVRLVSDESVPSGTRITGLAWGDRVFTSKREFTEFLAARGVLYEEWAARHPGAAPWQRSGAPARADATDGGEATAQRSRRPAESAAPPKPAAPEATDARRAPPSAAAPSSTGDGLSSRLAPAALVLALVTLLLMAARRVGLRPAVVAVTAAGPALHRPRKRRPSEPRRPPLSVAKASVAVATATPAPPAKLLDIPEPDDAAEPGRRFGLRGRGLVWSAAVAARAALTTVGRQLATLRALPARAVAGARVGALDRKREAAPRATPSALAPVARAGGALAGLASRARATAARAIVAGVESVRWFLRGRGFNAMDAATYSLAIVAAAGIGVVIAFVAGP